MNFNNISKATFKTWLFCFKITLIIYLLINPSSTFSNNKKDTINIKAIEAKPDIVSKNVIGANIKIIANLKYFNEIKKSKSPSSIIFQITISNENNKPVFATESSTFKKFDNKVAISQEFFNDRTNFNIFIPYYCLKLEKGTQKLNLSVSAFVRDTSITDSPREIVCSGNNNKQISINKPATKSLKILVQGVKITEFDRKGSSWDWTGGLADIFYKISLNSAVNSDILFYSTTVKNAQSAAWMDYSKTITISENDKITIGIFDEDTMFHDNIGQKDFTYDELIKVSDSETELSFEQVTFMILKVKK